MIRGESLTRRAVGQPRASATYHGHDRAARERGGRRAGGQPRPPQLAVAGERAREQQRPRREAMRRDHARCGRVEALGAHAQLREVGEREHRRHGEQPPARLQEVVVTSEAHVQGRR